MFGKLSDDCLCCGCGYFLPVFPIVAVVVLETSPSRRNIFGQLEDNSRQQHDIVIYVIPF